MRGVVAGACVLVALIVATWMSCAPQATKDEARPAAAPPATAPRSRESRRSEPSVSKRAETAQEVEEAPASETHRAAPIDGVTIRGRVVLADTRAPAAGVAVRAWVMEPRLAEVGEERLTNTDGRFEIAGPPAGTDLLLYAVKRGFRTTDWTGKASAGLDLELVLGDGGVLEGTVFDENGRPIPGADVFLLQPERPIPPLDIGGREAGAVKAELLKFVFLPDQTDELGHYRFEGLRLSTAEKQQPRCAVARDVSGREVRSEPVVFGAPGERQTRDLHFAGPGAVRVVVRNAAGRGVGVTLQRGGAVSIAKQLDPDSSCVTFDLVAAGTRTVWTSVLVGHGFWTLTNSHVEVKGGETTLVEFDIGRAVPLTGRVVNDAGAPVTAASLRFLSASPELDQEARTGTNANGLFQFDTLLPQPGHVVVEQVGMRDGNSSVADASWVDATPGGEPITIVMRRVTTLRGRVVPVPAGRRITFDVRADDATTGNTIPVEDDGAFEYVVPTSGERVFISLRAEGTVPVVVVDGSMKPGATIDLGEVKLDQGVTLDTLLRDSDGHALAGANVDCLDFFLHGRKATTDADGRLRIESVPRHALRLLVHETPTTPMSRPVIADPAAPPAIVTIAAGGLVTGRVVDAAGGPLTTRVLISFRRKTEVPDPDGKTTWAFTEPDGAYSVRLEPGLYRALVRDANQGPALSDSVDLGVADGETRTLDFRLR